MGAIDVGIGRSVDVSRTVTVEASVDVSGTVAVVSRDIGIGKFIKLKYKWGQYSRNLKINLEFICLIEIGFYISVCYMSTFKVRQRNKINTQLPVVAEFGIVDERKRLVDDDMVSMSEFVFAEVTCAVIRKYIT